MKTADVSRTHSQQHQTEQSTSSAPEQEQAFFSERSSTPAPFFPGSTPLSIQPKLSPNTQPFFQPSRTLQLKCDSCEAEEKQDNSPPVQRMPAFESDADAPMVQPKRMIQRQVEPLEAEPEKDSTEEAGLFDPVAGNAAPADDAGESPTSPFAQMKLTIGRPNDSFEQEADAVADQVVAQPKRQENLAAGIQTQPLDKVITRLPSHPTVAVPTKQLQRRFHLQKQENHTATASDDVASRLNSSRGGGSTLDDNTRGEMESSFGADFSNVRIHTGSDATQLSQDLGAKAFTHGSDIYFNQGQYNPNSSDGKHLLAHELTHTVQQGAAIQTKPLINHHTNTQTVQRFSISEIIESVVNKVPGYGLVKVILGKSPITGQSVPRTGLNIIKAVLGLLPGIGDTLFKKLQESGAATEAGNWLDSELGKLNITFVGIKALIAEARERISIFNGFSTNLRIIKEVFGPTWGRIKRFLGNVADKLKDFIFRGALKLVGAPVEKIMGILNKGTGTIRRIINDPIGFLGQLVRAVKGGVQGFVGNIKTHLIGGLIDWLTGAMSDVPIQLPQKFDLRGILDLVLQILGLTWQRIRAQLVKRVGEKPVALAEKSVDIIKRLIKEGPMALWEMLKEKAADIKQQVMDGIQNWMIVNLVKQGVIKLLSFVNPAGALVQAALGIYNLVMFLIENGSRIAEFVSSVLNSISEIAQGAVKPAAKFIEAAMARTVPIILNFLARLIGLSGIGKTVSKIIERIRKPVDTVVGKVIDKIVKFVKRIARKAKDKAKKIIRAFIQWTKIKETFKTKNGEQHSIFIKGKGKATEIMVASQQQKLQDYFVESNNRLTKSSASDKPKKLQALADAKTHYSNALTLRNDLLTLETQLQTATGNKAKQLKGDIRVKEAEIRKQFREAGEKIKIIGIGPPAPLTTNIQPSSGSGGTPLIKADPLTPLPGNTKGSAPNRGSKTEPPGWAHLVSAGKAQKKAGTANSDTDIFNFWARMHLIHEEMHGPGKSFNLVPARGYLNDQAYHGVEKLVLKRLTDPEAILFYETKVDYHQNSNKPYLKDFPAKVTINWAEYTDYEAGTKIDKTPFVGEMPEKDIPEVTGAMAVSPELVLSTTTQRTFVEVFKNFSFSPHIARRLHNSYLDNTFKLEPSLAALKARYKKKQSDNPSLYTQNPETRAEGDWDVLKSLDGQTVDVGFGPQTIKAL